MMLVVAESYGFGKIIRTIDLNLVVLSLLFFFIYLIVFIYNEIIVKKK